MNIFIVPSWYPTNERPINGIFFKEQAEALAKSPDIKKVSVLIIRIYSIKTIQLSDYIKVVRPLRFTRKNAVTLFEYSYIQFPKIRKIQEIQKKLCNKRFVKRVIAQVGRPDIVHLHSFTAGDLALELKKLDVKYIITEHSTAFARNILSTQQLAFAGKIFKHAAYRLAVSREFCSLLNSYFDCSFEYLPNIVDTDFFSPVNKKSNSEFRFINIASLDDKKNHRMLIDSFYLAFSNMQNVNLLIVGEGPLKASLCDKVHQLGLNGRIHLFGSATRLEVKELLNSSDAFVLSSKYETFGVVIIEALSCGLPVLSTKCGGPETIIINEKLGELVLPTIEDLANGLQIIVRGKYNKDYIRNYSINNYSSAVIVKQLVEIYNNVISS
jgi:glycosyltransferase involved in cell wall biosynthesis